MRIVRLPARITGRIACLRRIGLLAAALAAGASGVADAATVTVFPIPGSRVAPPQAQIVFRGVSARALGRVSVSGSRSGRHVGRIAADSDSDGASFLPSRPFAPGETVTVHTSQTVLGGRGGSFAFTVAQPADAIQAMRVSNARRQPGDILIFHSRPDLKPARIDVLRDSAPAAEGDIFLGPQVGPVQNGPMIIDPSGRPVWFAPIPAGTEANDLRVQQYQGRPVLTWWQGYLDLRIGVGTGHDVIEDSSYRPIAQVHAADGLTADLHEFTLTPAGTALITAYFPVFWNASALHGSTHQRVLDSVVQQIDVRTGLLLYQWDSLDHVPLNSSEIGLTRPSANFDYFHVNSVQEDSDGSLIVSSRNTWAVYKISRQDGHVIWTLGGRYSSFLMGPGAAFAFQHDVLVSGAGDSALTVFDDGAGPPLIHRQSRALHLRLDTVHHVAVVTADFTHSPSLLANYEGDVQTLADGNDFVGWGQQPYFTEFSPTGAMIFDARFAASNTTYRAYRASWTGTPHTRPAIAASGLGQASVVYASWNGATLVAAWRVLTGPRPSSLSVAGTFARTGFETTMRVTRRAYAQVQALDGAGRVLGRSATVRSS